MTVRQNTDPRLDEDDIGWFWALSAAGIAIVLMVTMALSATDCRSFSDEQARLACYDASAQLRPAKGAPAPVFMLEK